METTALVLVLGTRLALGGRVGSGTDWSSSAAVFPAQYMNGDGSSEPCTPGPVADNGGPMEIQTPSTPKLEALAGHNDHFQVRSRWISAVVWGSDPSGLSGRTLKGFLGPCK